MNNALKKSIDEILNLAINEDQTKSDLTSHLTLKNKKIKANIIFKEDGVLSGTIQITGGPYNSTNSMASALETAINADNILAQNDISVDVDYLSDKYIITSKKYGSNSSVLINSIDNGLNNYLGIQSGSSTTGTGGTVGASLTNSALEQTSLGFRTTSGDALGLSMNVTAPGASAYISIGNSFLSGLSEYLSQILTPKGLSLIHI